MFRRLGFLNAMITFITVIVIIMLPSRPEEDGFLHLGMPGTGILTVIMIVVKRMIVVIIRILIAIILARI